MPFTKRVRSASKRLISYVLVPLIMISSCIAPTTGKDSPTPEEDSTIRVEDSQTAEKDSSTGKEDSPTAEKDLPTTKEDLPTPKKDPLTIEKVSPIGATDPPTTGKNSVTDWLIDSGAGEHFCCHEELFKDLRGADTSQPLTVGLHGSVSRIEGTGTVELEVGGENLSLKEVKYAPATGSNIISVAQLADEGIMANFDEKACHLHSSENNFKGMRKSDGKYWLEM